MPQLTEHSLDQLVNRARSLVVSGQRRILGITGAPGAGKSTLAHALVRKLAPHAVLVSMDGYHLANAVLEQLGRRPRKGAEDTFDAAGYVSLLRRLHRQQETVVYAPEFRREIEEPIAGAIPVAREVPLVVTEGNYLLVDRGAWAPVRHLLDETWFLAPEDDLRLLRLARRHEAFGKNPVEAERWARGSDQRNADLIDTTRDRADLLVRLTDQVAAATTGDTQWLI
ncbi:nucleoside/nucleotide kinase family protein [Streptomyces sp. NPDC005708]|uniref:nucleoside/nucleotide kinase family protein n=1 Tax=Streptomyces sp. NPDC005708 TaxID=3154564 RepID=UPI003402FD6A